MVGPKRTLMIGVVGFAIASVLAGASQTTGMLIGARALQGMFRALLAPSVLSLLTTTFTDPRERGRAFGIIAIAIAGAAFGLILGGLLTQYLDWRWCLYVNLPFAAIVAIGAFTMVPRRSGHPGGRLDIPGAILGCGGLVALVYGLGEAATDGWTSLRAIVPIVTAVVLLALFVLVQATALNRRLVCQPCPSHRDPSRARARIAQYHRRHGNNRVPGVARSGHECRGAGHGAWIHYS
jgi:MFS family permease